MNNINILYEDLSNKFITDVTLIISDKTGATERMDAHKAILASGSMYFYDMFKFPGNRTKTEFPIEVPRVKIPAVKMVVLSFYGKSIDYSNIEYLFDIFVCLDYLLIASDFNKLYGIDIPVHKFNSFVRLICRFKQLHNSVIAHTLIKNMPQTYNTKTLPSEIMHLLQMHKHYIIISDSKQTKIFGLDGNLLYTFDFDNHINMLAMSTSANLIVTWDYYVIKIWNIIQRKCIQTIDIILYFPSGIDKIHISPDDSIIVIIDNHNIGFWDVVSGKNICMQKNVSTIFSIEISSDNSFYVYDTHKEIIILDLLTHNRLYELSESTGQFVISPDSSLIISKLGGGKRINIYDTKSFQQVRTIKTEDYIRKIACNNNIVAYVNEDELNNVMVYCLKTGQFMKKICCCHSINSLLVSLDGLFIITTGSSNIKIWSIETTMCISSFPYQKLLSFGIKQI